MTTLQNIFDLSNFQHFHVHKINGIEFELNYLFFFSLVVIIYSFLLSLTAIQTELTSLASHVKQQNVSEKYFLKIYSNITKKLTQRHRI